MLCNLLKYSHDRVADENVNIGMVFFAPNETYFIQGDLKRVKKLWTDACLPLLLAYVKSLKIGIEHKTSVDEIINTTYPVSVYFGEDIVLSDNILRGIDGTLKSSEDLKRDLQIFASKFLVGIV